MRIKKLLIVALLLFTCSVSAKKALLEIDTIDQLLANQESNYSDIVENTEKSVRWFAGNKTKTEYSIVYLHGFSASRQELSPVTENLADKLCANVFFTRLRGHARSDDAMAEATIQEWLNDTRFAYQIGALIGDKVILLSASTGSTLATWLSAQAFADKLYANLMVSPNFGIKDRIGEIVRWSWGLKLATWLNGAYREFTPSSELHAKYWTERYPIEAVVPMIKLVDNVVEMDKSAIKTPQLMVYSPDDQVISVKRIPDIAAQMVNAKVTLTKYKTSTDLAQHVLAGDAVSPENNEDMVTTLLEYLGNL